MNEIKLTNIDEERFNKLENNRKQVKLAFYYLFHFRVKQGSYSTRLSLL